MVYDLFITMKFGEILFLFFNINALLDKEKFDTAEMCKEIVLLILLHNINLERG